MLSISPTRDLYAPQLMEYLCVNGMHSLLGQPRNNPIGSKLKSLFEKPSLHTQVARLFHLTTSLAYKSYEYDCATVQVCHLNFNHMSGLN